MTQCATCGNDYDNAFEVTLNGETHAFDSFECAIQRLAPRCGSCGCRVLGHGVQGGEQIFCSRHCAEAGGVNGIADRV
jgi:hypothetical protein